MAPRFASVFLAASVICGIGLSGIGITACGDDGPSKADFVAKLQQITTPPIKTSLAECAYDKVKSDPQLMQHAMTKTSIPKSDEDKLAKIMARCVLGKDAPPGGS